MSREIIRKMEFEGVGTVSLEHPPEDLQPFMKRKMKTWVRTWSGNIKGTIYRSELEKEVELLAGTLPEHAREQAIKKRLAIWSFVCMCDYPGDEISEDEVVDIWLKRMYGDPQPRHEYMEKTKKCATEYFHHMDLDKDGVISPEEWRKGNSILKEDAIMTVFNAIDSNGDGFISLQEFLFAIISYIFCSGPDSSFSSLYGPVPEEDY